MAWAHQYEASLNGVSDGTNGLMDKLYDWLTGVTPGFPGSLFTGVVKNGRISNPGGAGNVTLSNLNRIGTTYHYNDLAFYAVQRSGVTYWFMCDVGRSPVAGGTRGFMNTGIFAAIIDDASSVGTSGSSTARCDSFKAFYNQSTFGDVANGSLNTCLHQIFPTYGSVEADFFSDGTRIHVVMRRSVNSHASYNHFSFGVIDKASTTWSGGEYISGGCVTDLSSDVSRIGFSDPYCLNTNRLCLSGGPTQVYNSGTTGGARFANSVIRVAGVKDSANVTQNHCQMSHKLGAVAKISSSNAAALAAITSGGSVGWGMTLGSSSTSPYSSNRRGAIKESPNSWNGRAAGLGVDIFYLDLYNTPNNAQLLGSVPGLRYLNITGLTDRQVINNEWMVFPVWNRVAPTASWDENIHADSGYLGIAYKLP